tara:strand:+ start:831 stop:1361 length:531 start_codon:yes stop_codon:yes gene_type:complete
VKKLFLGGALVVFALLAFSGTATFAIGVDDERLKDPAAEARAQTLMKQLRCLVCQNQSIVDSNADLARDLRMIVRERVMAGDTDAEIIAFMTSRYGDWVLLKPPLKEETLALWFLPVGFLLLGGILVILYLRRTPRTPDVTPLSPEEQERLARLLPKEETGPEETGPEETKQGERP